MTRVKSIVASNTVVEAFVKIRDITSPQVSQRDLYIIYFHEHAGEALYKNVREQQGISELGMGINSVDSKTQLRK